MWSVAHHEWKPTASIPNSVAAEICRRDVGFGAVGCDPYHGGTGPMGVPDGSRTVPIPGRTSVATRARDHPGDGSDPFQIGVPRSRSYRSSGQSVPVGYLDGESTPARVECGRDSSHLSGAVLVTDRVRAVTQGDVADVGS